MQTTDATTADPIPLARPPAYELILPGSFESERHFYPRVLNAQIHPLVRYFLSLSSERIVLRYCHLHPTVDPSALTEILAMQPRHFRWAGSDLLYVTTETGIRHTVVIETNSCPSGQKSMPLYEETDEQGGYRATLENAFLPLLKGRRLPQGGLAVIYDKNLTEAAGYAAAMADLVGEPVHLVEFPDEAQQPRARFRDGVLEIRGANPDWLPIRCAFRYVTQRPWHRIPVASKTLILNPVLACLAGGRNKTVAAKAYEFFNAELEPTGLKIRTPETMWDVSAAEVPLWVRKLGGLAVVKVPYSNAGQGVYTITSESELRAFSAVTQRYDRFIVQSLIGNYNWSSHGRQGRLFHVGTLPNKRGLSFVADLRVMVCAGPNGFRPLVIYARRARQPLLDTLDDRPSWDVLGTNLSVRAEDGAWASDTSRLLLVDRKDFNTLGLGPDDLIEAYIQSVLATVAIEKMARRLASTKGGLRTKLFRSLNNDAALVAELMDERATRGRDDRSANVGSPARGEG